ncbi:unnamed protein product [Mytilus edulis]|uniref:Transposase domain-containing protein n=1 Tax=Mytilus edulis TaxID=6550 RepID=A0A8S3QM48_MYTED|nr:unnamed protein product [Mytilus edulis]
MPPKHKLSTSHEYFKKKKRRKMCPGCGGEFVDRHFENHKVEYFWDNKWECSKSNKSKREENSYQEVPPEHTISGMHQGNHCEEPSTSGVQQPLAHTQSMIEVKRRFKDHLRSLSGSETYPESDNEDEEFWSNVTLNDIDMDIENENIHEIQEKKQQTDFDTAKTEMIKSTVAIFQSICIFLCCWQSFYIITDTALSSILSFLSTAFKHLSAENVALTGVSSIFPCSVYMLYKNLGMKKDNYFSKYVICKKCFTLYNYEDCIIIIEGETSSKKCSKVMFPNHRQIARRNQCGEPLLKSVKLKSGDIKLYPYKTYCYKSVKESLSTMVKQKYFEDKCEEWRHRRQEPGVMTDVYDGKIWKEFGEDKNQHFLKTERNYGLMLNLDWFQPFEHVRYSVGVIYAVVLNLPREERFKLKNVFLVGIIPDMSGEPSVQTFIKPFVEEMKIAWSTGFLLRSHNNPKKDASFKLAAWCNPRVLQMHKEVPWRSREKNYGGFDVPNWRSRSLPDHLYNLERIKEATTKTDKENMESQFGIRYSPLCELDYFDPIRMSVIDPMHNLYQGTAKKMIKLWSELKILESDKLKIIEKRVDSVSVAANVGSLPRKIATSFGGFTADQWKNWTNVFSIFALKGVIPSEDFEVWRKFVLASRCITTKTITTVDILKYEKLILEFCSGFERIYGDTKVTPNMHLHYHMADCIRDYGPVYSFWLFSFERYNGHLGSLPNNSRSIELQIMRRFLRDSFVNCLQVPSEYKETLDKAFFLKEPTAVSVDVQTDEDVSCIMYMGKKNAPISDQQWTNIKPYRIQKSMVDSLSSGEHAALKNMYKILYPGREDMIIPMSSRRCSSLFLGNEVLGSWDSRQRRSSYIMAYWNDFDGRIMRDAESVVLTPGIVQKYILHNLIVEGNNQIHLLAKVNWFTPLPASLRYHCGEPIEAWNSELIDTFGPSAFIPVQRFYCRFVQADGFISNKTVSFVCPLNNGLNV